MKVAVNAYSEIGTHPDVRKFYPQRKSVQGRIFVPEYEVSPNEAKLLYMAGRLRPKYLREMREILKGNKPMPDHKTSGEATIVGQIDPSTDKQIESVNHDGPILAGDPQILGEMDQSGLNLQAEKGKGPVVNIPTQIGSEKIESKEIGEVKE